jgi:hypothetical protein
MSLNADEFMRWYIGIFLPVMGVLFFFTGRDLCQTKFQFWLELRDPKVNERLRAVLTKRDAMENMQTMPWRIIGVLAVFAGIAVLSKWLSPVVGYALFCLGMTAAMSQIYLSLRNRTERRAAVLAPRGSAVPPILYAGALLASVLPLATLDQPSLRASALIIALACVGIVFVAYRASSMAALLGGDDPEIELFVDNRLRWARVGSLLLLSFAISFLYTSVAEAATHPVTLLANVASWIATLLFLAFAGWFVSGFVRGRMRAPVAVL